jgi:uncharacterized protein YozE (UPF0346 family)
VKIRFGYQGEDYDQPPVYQAIDEQPVIYEDIPLIGFYSYQMKQRSPKTQKTQPQPSNLIQSIQKRNQEIPKNTDNAPKVEAIIEQNQYQDFKELYSNEGLSDLVANFEQESMVFEDKERCSQPGVGGLGGEGANSDYGLSLRGSEQGGLGDGVGDGVGVGVGVGPGAG